MQLSVGILAVAAQLTAVYAPLTSGAVARRAGRCRVQPGDRDFPDAQEWESLNQQVGGRLLTVVPSAKFCHELPSGNCTFEQWNSAVFKANIPGAMQSNNWEQNYYSNPPSLCTQNGTECGQGNVPVYAINASSAADLQAGVRFAAQHDLKLSVKASGHDYLGRSTAKGSLLLWTHHLKNLTFTESFTVGGEDLGSAVTVGSGVALNELYAATKAQSKFVVAGFAATVTAAGGYIQGAGHSAFSPAYGLAADNVLQFEVVTANGELVTANKASHSDLFWALRGGGAGNWGVIVSATFRTFPIFNVASHLAIFYSPTNATVGNFAEMHARHAFDIEPFRAGQYFYYIDVSTPEEPGVIFAVSTLFPNATIEQANETMQPFINDAVALNWTLFQVNTTTGTANDAVFVADGDAGGNTILGSRLIPEDVYRNSPEKIGATYQALIDAGVRSIPGNMIAGGKVSENADIDSAVSPKWRTAKMLFIISDGWADDAPVPQIDAIKNRLTNEWVPKLAELTGLPDSGTYSNEADVREPNFQVTFYGPNYGRLQQIKRKYDPESLFIVKTGVGSEGWDDYGICRTN